MSEENTVPEADQANTGGAHVDDVVSKSELTKVIDQRQQLKAKLREYEARFAETESQKQEAQEAAIRAQGENEKIITTRDARIAELENIIATENRRKRFSATAQAVSAKAGIDLAIAEALLLREEQVSGADVALEELDDESVTELAKALRASAPSLFQTSGKGGSPSTPGLNMANKNAGEADGKGKWFAKAQAYSAHNRKQG